MLAAAAVGLILGILTYTFIYARGYSYLSDNPAACMNCHIMNEQFDGWLKSSHHGVAVCNDCHTPPGFLGKYYTKALNGFFHSVAFTSGNFHEPIRITKRNARVAEKSCRKCHSRITHAIRLSGAEQDDNRCARCHLDVGHMH